MKRVGWKEKDPPFLEKGKGEKLKETLKNKDEEE